MNEPGDAQNLASTQSIRFIDGADGVPGHYVVHHQPNTRSAVSTLVKLHQTPRVRMRRARLSALILMTLLARPSALLASEEVLIDVTCSAELQLFRVQALSIDDGYLRGVEESAVRESLRKAHGVYPVPDAVNPIRCALPERSHGIVYGSGALSLYVDDAVVVSNVSLGQYRDAGARVLQSIQIQDGHVSVCALSDTDEVSSYTCKWLGRLSDRNLPLDLEKHFPGSR